MKETYMQMLLHQIMHLSSQQSMRLLEEFDLKPGQARILFELNRQGGMSQKELAEKMDVTPPSVTMAIQKMEKQEYITRRLDEKDQRIIRLEITDKGKGCAARLKSVMERMEEILFGNMSPEEKMLLRRLLIQMRTNLENCKELKGIKICPPMN